MGEQARDARAWAEIPYDDMEALKKKRAEAYEKIRGNDSWDVRIARTMINVIDRTIQEKAIIESLKATRSALFWTRLVGLGTIAAAGAAIAALFLRSGG